MKTCYDKPFLLAYQTSQAIILHSIMLYNQHSYLGSKLGPTQGKIKRPDIDTDGLPE